MPSRHVKTFARMCENRMRKLLTCVRKNEEALLNQPVKAVCAKRAVIVRQPAFQAGGHGSKSSCDTSPSIYAQYGMPLVCY
jgi:hypothetical protein